VRKLALMNKRILLATGLVTTLFATAPFGAEVASNMPPQSATAPDKEAGKQSDKESTKEKSKEPEEKRVESDHSVKIGGQEVKYKATAGTILLRDDDDKPTASIFYIAYVRQDMPASNRPITFSFNGGPGSSSVWMHLGMLGPRRVRLAEDGSALPPPYQLVDNEYSLLDESDLVFIDPVSTGYSRAIPPKDAGNSTACTRTRRP
jgi:carboxypeptidase C (cathepsin A)